MKPDVKEELDAIERQHRRGGGGITSHDFCMLIINIHLIRAIDQLDQNSTSLINTSNRLTAVGLAATWIAGAATVLAAAITIL